MGPEATRPVPPFELETSDLGGVRLLRVDGEVDIATAPTLREAVESILAGDPVAVVIDLSAVPFLDSTGLGVLVAAYKGALERGVLLSLAGPQRIVANSLRLVHIDTVIPVHDTVAAAVAAAGSPPSVDLR